MSSPGPENGHCVLMSSLNALLKAERLRGTSEPYRIIDGDGYLLF